MTLSVFDLSRVGIGPGSSLTPMDFMSLDKVIRTMRDTGADMKSKYKETARGGLGVNVLEAPLDFTVNLPEC